VGSGRETSVNELAAAVLASLGESPASWEMRRQGAQLGDQSRAAADISGISALGWAPSVSLAAGLERTVAWASTLT